MKARSGPLAGVRIIEMDGIGPVPLAAMILADMGADIVRIARPPHEGAAWDDVGGAVLHRGRDVAFLNLKDEADRARVLTLAGRADALIEGFRPGVMERLGLGPEVCLDRNPRLVYGRMTGWGQVGPFAPRAGHDLNYISISGALHAMGEAGSPPPVPLNLVGDYGGGAMFLIAGVLAALLSTKNTGKGQVVDACMSDGAAVLMSMFYAFKASGAWIDAPASNLLDGAAPFYRCYECADGGHVAVGSLEPQFFAQLTAGLGLEPGKHKQADTAGWQAMQAEFAAIFKTRTRDEWAARFAGTDACVTPVLSMNEAPGHPHNRARGAFVERNGVVQPGVAPRFSHTPTSAEEPGICDAASLEQRWR